jgi:CBS domain containing-hemolysin-like protein
LAAGNKRAALALKIAIDYDTVLSTVLIGNNIANIAASAVATLLFISFFGNAGVSLATLVMTVLLLLLGEISPKTLAKEAPEQTAMFFAPFLACMILILRPVNRMVRLWKEFIVKLFRVRGDRSVTEAELLTFVEEVRQEGGINQREEDMIRRTIEFDDLSAGDIYTPRVDVAAVAVSDSIEAIERKFQETGYSRLPVYEDSIDRIRGVLLFKDFYFFSRACSQETLQGPLDDTKLEPGLIKPVVFITKTMKVAKLLKTLQEKKCHLAVLVDEFGGTMGIITVEDIVEELVGEIWDEHDEVLEHISKLGEQTYKVLGNTDIEDLCVFFSQSMDEMFPVEEVGHYRHLTLGSWVVEKAGGVPREGDRIMAGDLVFTVSRVKRNRVLELVVTTATALSVVPSGGRSPGCD